jgi:methionine sulfoxide reductase heme-binding subunit
MTATQVVRRIVKPVVFVGGLTPLALLVADGFRGELGVNPVETVTNTTGIWTLRLIALTIAITPVRWLTGWNPIIQLRRMVGLFGFFYGSLHFMTYFVLDHSLMFDGLWDDVMKRPYITVGFTAFVLLIPLAITSTQGWIRRLGGRRWNLVHKLVYVTAGLAVLHYWWKVKLDTSSPMMYAIIIGGLLAIRLWRWSSARQSVPVRRRSSPVAET